MKLPLFIFFILLISLVNPSAAQKIVSSKDEQNIKRKSLLLINRLADKYNQLLESDSFERNILIDNMTLPGGKGALSDFVSDQVIIEDDFNTDTTRKHSVIDKKVDDYFKDMGLYYGIRDNGEYINEKKKVVFSNVVTSDILYIKKDGAPYLQVFFEVKYDGIDARTQSKFIQPARRVADIQIVKQNGIWQVGIKSLRFYTEKPIETVTSTHKNRDSQPKKPFTKTPLPKEDSVANTLAKNPAPLKANLSKKDSSTVLSLKNNPKKGFNSYIPEIIVAGTGLISTVLAINLNKKWDNQFSSLGNNYSLHKEAEEFKAKKLGMRNAYVGIAITAAAVDAFLILRKTMTPKNNKLSVTPNAAAPGITLNYNF